MPSDLTDDVGERSAGAGLGAMGDLGARLRDAGERVALRPGHLGLLAAVALVAIGVAVALFWLSRPQQDALAIPPEVAVAPGGAEDSLDTPLVPAGTGTGTTVATESSSPAGEATVAGDSALVIHVAGSVRRPGVVELPTGSRVVDAISQAGGALRRADVAAVNLARVLSDGEYVWVPRRGGGERPPQAASPTAGASPGLADAGVGVQPAGPISVNSASVTELQTLPGVGPVLAQRIITWREEFGPFTAVDQLMDVSGIGPSVLEQVRPLVVL
jgi:competence protein ComEA